MRFYKILLVYFGILIFFSCKDNNPKKASTKEESVQDLTEDKTVQIKDSLF